MKKIFNAIIMSLVLIFSALSVSAARLPNVGEDSNQWGNILNEYLLISHTQNGTLNSSLSPTFNGLTLTDRLIMDSPGPTFSGASSRQTVQADALFSSFTGTYGAGIMGNAVSGTIGTGNSIIGGIIGKYNLADSDPSDHPQGAVIGEIGEDVGTTTLPDGAFIAVLGGDTAEVDAGAAYAVRYLNSVPGSKFNYGLDLFSAAIDSYSPVTYGTADIRLANGATIYNNDANTLTLTEGTIVIDGALTLNSGVINTTEIADGTITNDDIANDAITASKIAANAVDSSEIAADAVGSSEIETGAVGTSEIGDGTIANADVNASAAISFSKLASLTSGNILVGSGTNVPTSVAISGDAVLSNAGVLTISADSVALGTDTTGNYAGSSSEGGAATTATALAVNGANCGAGNHPLGVDASGVAESCTADDDTPDSDAEVPNAITISGGAIDSSVIGGSTPASGTFTTLVSTTLDTGNGANELYDMNQNVQTTDAVIFSTVDTGQGANELYDMDQNVLTTSLPTFAGLTITGSGDLDFDQKRLLLDDPGPTFSDTLSSRQTIQADATFSTYKGTGSYGAAVMGHAKGTLHADASTSIIAGLIGKYNINTIGGNTGPKGAVVGEVGEEATGTKANGAFIAVLGGDPATAITPGAAYTVRHLNSNAASKFDYGIDLSGAAIGSYQPVTYAKADIKLTKSTSAPTCDANNEGAIYYNSVDNNFYGCDGTSWIDLTA